MNLFSLYTRMNCRNLCADLVSVLKNRLLSLQQHPYRKRVILLCMLKKSSTDGLEGPVVYFLVHWSPFWCCLTQWIYLKSHQALSEEQTRMNTEQSLYLYLHKYRREHAGCSHSAAHFQLSLAIFPFLLLSQVA